MAPERRATPSRRRASRVRTRHAEPVAGDVGHPRPRPRGTGREGDGEAVPRGDRSLARLPAHRGSLTVTRAHQVFLLSPANCAGKRAGYLLDGRSHTPLAERLQSHGGAPIGEIFTFMSALYFRGKLAYASTFAKPPAAWDGTQVIVSGR